MVVFGVWKSELVVVFFFNELKINDVSYLFVFSVIDDLVVFE